MNEGGPAPTPLVPISWGELIDKITILELKRKNIKSAEAVGNVTRELAYLQAIVDREPLHAAKATGLKASLLGVNEALWIVEDRLREKEELDAFDAAFIDLARSVYRLNDERARIKREINLRLQSELIEEKSYGQQRS